MELLNALKSMLASLTSKTTATSTDGVMTINASDGTPNGRMTLANLSSALFTQSRQISSSEDLNNFVNPSICYFWTGANMPVNAPFANGIMVCDFYRSASSFAQLCLFTSSNNPRTMIRYQDGAGNWGGWKELAMDVPAFYKSYANLAALATGIMGQTISSITAAYFQGTIAQAVFDNVFIAVTRLSDTYPLAVKPKDWSTYSSPSAYHLDGVLLVSGDKHLVIAPSEATLRWGADSDSHAASGNTPTSDRDTAMATFDGKARTNTAVQVSEYAATTTAPGYCHAFTTVTDAYDTTKTAYARRKAGMWWLPSLGEMMMIWSNMIKINQVMSLIGGTAIAEDWYWTSTEGSQADAWGLGCSGGIVYGNAKKTTSHVRPVAAF